MTWREEPRTILFDLDGTLVDTRADITANVNRALAELSDTPLSMEKVMSHVGYGAKYLLEACLRENLPAGEIDGDIVTDCLERFRQFYAENLIEHASIFPGVREFLESQAIPAAVISNKPETFVRGILEGLDLASHFLLMWGKDSTHHPKPEPGVILEALSVLAMPPGPGILFIGDSPVDIEAGKSAGCTTIGITHGFANSAALTAAGPDYLVHDFKAIQQLLT